MSDDLLELYQQVILDHSRSPRNCRKMEDANREAAGHNPLCGDQIHVYLRVKDDVVEDISFEGSGCAISKASASVMTTVLKGKKLDEVKKYFDDFHQMITTGQAMANEGKMAVFSGVHKFPTRIKCAILPWHAVVASLDGKQEPVTTE